MRVLMFCPQFAPLVGGAERQAERLGAELRRQGVDVRVLTPRLDTNSPAQELHDGVLPVRRFALSDLSRRFPRLRGIGLVNAPWIAAQVCWHVWREACSVDIVHCHIGCLQTVAVAIAARVRGVPVICKAAMADEQSDLGEAAKCGFTGRLVARLGRIVFVRWVATTHAVEDALSRAGVAPERITVIPNGVQLSPESANLRRGPVRRFLYLGRLSTNIERDVPGLIRAFDLVARNVLDVELAIVGGGDLLEETRALARQCHSEERILVPGPGNPEDWLNWADCFVLPSRREGLSNALLEAMAAGLPCIANDIPPNREVLLDGCVGVLVPPGDEAVLVAEMLRMISATDHSVAMGQAARNRVLKVYTIVAVAQRYIDLYRALASSKTAVSGGLP
jgi:glycosyltransferase involved in cell wall biosynthesis